MEPKAATILSEGMGVESVAILLRWMEEPELCPVPLQDLLVITAQTGDEWADTCSDMEQHMLPRMRALNMRYVQVARHGHLEKDGITVLEDSRQPSRIFGEGDWKLSDELRATGTVPQFGGEHRCSLKFKAFVIERWLDENIRTIDGVSIVRHAFGYNSEELKRVEKSEKGIAKRNQRNAKRQALNLKQLRAKSEVMEHIAFGFNIDEPKRVAKSMKYHTPTRKGFYPLVEWGWTRQDCIDYIYKILGVIWKKSACVQCPFAKNCADLERRRAAHPHQTADAVMLEHVSLAMNPRGTLYAKKALIQIVAADGNTAVIEEHRNRVADSLTALYRVRRVYSKKGKADRAVERIGNFPNAAEATTALHKLACHIEAPVEAQREIEYAYVERRIEGVYPAREEFYVTAPAFVDTKSRYGIPKFEEVWEAAAL